MYFEYSVSQSVISRSRPYRTPLFTFTFVFALSARRTTTGPVELITLFPELKEGSVRFT